MTEEQQQIVRKIIHNELQEFFASDRYVFHKTIQILDGRNLQIGLGNGTKIGTSSTQKLGFYNTTPIIQRSGSAQVAVDTTSATQTTPWGYSTQAQANAIITLVNELRAWAVAQGFIKGSA